MTAESEPFKCAQCGSPNLVFEGPAEGYWCHSCGASDSDE